MYEPRRGVLLVERGMTEEPGWKRVSCGTNRWHAYSSILTQIVQIIRLSYNSRKQSTHNSVLVVHHTATVSATKMIGKKLSSET